MPVTDSKRTASGTGTWQQVRAIVSEAAADFGPAWRSLAAADLAYKLLAFAVLSPGTALLLHWLLSRSRGGVVADVDILRFFVASPKGILGLAVIGSLIVAITAVEVACLAAIGVGAARGKVLSPRSALVFAGSRVWGILRLSLHILARVLACVIPFAAAGGLGYLLLLHGHDINYYLADRPAQFRIAAVLGAALGVGLLVTAALLLTRWFLALPLVVFESVPPRSAFRVSAERTAGHRLAIAIVLIAWAGLALALGAASTTLLSFLGRAIAPLFGGSLPALALFIAVLTAAWTAAGLATAIFNVSAFSVLLARVYVHAGTPPETPAPGSGGAGGAGDAGGPSTAAGPSGPVAAARLSRLAIGIFLGAAVLSGVGLLLLALGITRADRPVLVIAHRGASAEAPENTLAAFGLAASARADFVELDVQESLDGEVVVVHDSDLMKVGGSSMKIWENAAVQLRSVDIGSHTSPKFSSERVPELAEVFEQCRGRVGVVVELKSYGHDQRLEERVAGLVESARMVDDCMFMSLDHAMARKMKTIRPHWRVGVLAAKAVGRLTDLHADFLAVNVKMATRRFMRQAHAAGQDVYVWTVNDPTVMMRLIGLGADGLITDRPALARQVVEQHAAMSEAQRVLTALMIRLGAKPDAPASEDELRP